MSDPTVELPEGWHRHRRDDRDDAIVEYRHETGENTTFVVSVRRRPDPSDRYELRLSTIDPGADHVRHDYPVETYETRTDALTDAESFVELLTSRLESGSVSATHPGIDEIRRAIDDFANESLLSPVRGLIHRLR